MGCLCCKVCKKRSCTANSRLVRSSWIYFGSSYGVNDETELDSTLGGWSYTTQTELCSEYKLSSVYGSTLTCSTAVYSSRAQPDSCSLATLSESWPNLVSKFLYVVDSYFNTCTR